jgi:hypothetical protein
MILTVMLTNAANGILTLNALIHSTKMASPQVIFFVKWVMKSVKCGEGWRAKGLFPYAAA